MRLQPLQDFASLREAIAPVKAEPQRVPRKAEVKHQNEQSMAALQAILSKVPNSPTRKKPRKTR